MPPQSPQPPYPPQPGPQPPTVSPQPPVQPQQPVQPGVQPNEYEFLMSPSKPPRRNLLPSTTSLPIRIAVIAGGIILLIILFNIVRGIVTTPPFNTAAMISIAQDQEEMIHITTKAIQQDQDQQASLSQNTMNFAVTANASLTSDQNQTITYLKKNGKKVKSGQLNQKISATTDEQLSAAAANSTYDSAYTRIMQTALKNYQTALKQTFLETKGVKARELLNQEYKSAQLLLDQLQSPGS